MHRVIEHTDFSILEGHRTLKRQQELWADGRTKLDGKLRKSKHQSSPSLAVDVLPWPPEVNGVSVWNDLPRFALLIGRIQGHADEMGINIRIGLDWQGNGEINSRFIDAPHVELMDP